jgi:hypothetical protein
MTTRITTTLGAAAGGLLAAAFLPMAVAFADDYTNDPQTPLDVLSQSGNPFLSSEDSGVQFFDVVDTTNSPTGEYDVVGQYYAAVNDVYGPNGDLLNQEQTVLAESGYGTTGAAPGDEPPQGSVLDTTNFGSGFENEYSDLAGAGTGGSNLITDTFVTPFGDFNIPTTLDLVAIDRADFDFSSLYTTAIAEFLPLQLTTLPADIPIPTL